MCDMPSGSPSPESMPQKWGPLLAVVQTLGCRPSDAFALRTGQEQVTEATCPILTDAESLLGLLVPGSLRFGRLLRGGNRK